MNQKTYIFHYFKNYGSLTNDQVKSGSKHGGPHRTLSHIFES